MINSTCQLNTLEKKSDKIQSGIERSMIVGRDMQDSTLLI